MADEKSEATPEIDDVHVGLVFPSDEELVTLRRVSDDIPWTAFLIAIVELAKRFSYYGAMAVFTNFIQQPLPPGSTTGAGGTAGQSGALGMGQRVSTGLTTFYMFWSFVCPIFGAYVADTYLGRYKTICVSVAIVLVGHIIMIFSAIPGIIGSDTSLVLFIISVVVTGFGTGGFKSSIGPLIAEQYRRTKRFIRIRKSGERVIVDPGLTTSRIYMYFFLFANIGALLGQVGMVYAEKYVGFWLAFTLPTCAFLITPLILWYGHGKYHTTPPTGSVLPTALRIWRHAAHGRWSWNPIRTVQNLTADDFWESAKPSKMVGEKPRWMRYDDSWVDEVRRGSKACSVYLWFPIYGLALSQLDGNLTSQAATLSTHGLPNDVLFNLDPLTLVIFIPIFDHILYPALARWKIILSPLQKISWGFYICTAAMIWSAVVQHFIYKTSPCGHYASTCVDADGNQRVSHLSVWVQTGSYLLLAFSEILVVTTGIEYAFTKAPRNMRSLILSIFLLTYGIAAAIGEGFVCLSADPLLVWNYASIAVLSGISALTFWTVFRKLNAEDDKLNDLAEGHLEE